MKKVNIYLMNKGGVGKTPLSIFTMIKLIKEDKKDFKIVDCDSNNHSLYNRFVGTEYEKYVAEISLAQDENSNMDYAALEGMFETLADQSYSEYYIDFGQDDSNALIKLIRSVGIEGLAEFAADLKLDITLCPVVAVGDLDSVKGMQTILALNKGTFKIVTYANMLNASSNEDVNLEQIKELCNKAKIELATYNRPNIADGFRTKIHNHLVSGLSDSLGLAKGLFTKIIEDLKIA